MIFPLQLLHEWVLQLLLNLSPQGVFQIMSRDSFSWYLSNGMTAKSRSLFFFFFLRVVHSICESLRPTGVPHPAGGAGDAL